MTHTPNPALLARLEAFDIDGGRAGADGLSFTSRLARENGWSEAFAARVIREYMRFVYLAMVAGHPVTPSDQVDQAWHLHLTYTRSYWERLCGEVLPRPLHHEPTRGGDSERSKFNDWYERTRQSYREIIGESPPADIWPDPAVRFGVDLAHQRINRARNLVIPRRLAAAAGAAALLGVVVVGCQPLVAQSSANAIAITLFVVFGITAVIALIAWRGRGGGGGSGGCGFFGGCGSDGGGGCGGGCGG